MTYTAIPNTDIDVDSPITTGLMTLMRDNPIAIMAKDAGAPVLANSYIVEAMLGASSVAQGKLKTTTGAVSTTATSALLALPGGEYGFYPQLKSNAGATLGFHANIFDGTADFLSVSYVTTIFLNPPASWTMYAQQRYIQSSPPYDIGNGEMNNFIFALMNKEGDIVSSYIAEDPPWANNGKTRVNPDYHVKKGKKIIGMQRIRERLATMEDVKAGRASMKDFATVAEREIEVTQAIKNADMGDIPQPFLGDLTDLTPVLIDPYSQFSEDMKLMQVDGEDVCEILQEHCIIDNKEISGLITPSGVKIVKGSFK